MYFRIDATADAVHDKPSPIRRGRRLRIEGTMDQIIAAVISALGSVIVALISKGSAPDSGSAGAAGLPQLAGNRHPPSGRRAWTVSLSLLIPWIIATPPLIHWDFVGVNMLVILIATLITSVI